MTSVRYDQATFSATHNSYSGQARGGIHAQLDRGVRFLELDVHDNEYLAHGFRVGHLQYGTEVDHSQGNPSDDLLDHWLRHIVRWSSEHHGHAPITLTLDLRDDLTDNRSFAEGDLCALNALLEREIGSRLVRAHSVGSTWPTVDSLRDKIIVVLSGDRGTRAEYLRDHGVNPAVAVNSRGQVVEVHDSGGGALWYWTGQLQSDGHVQWRRHGRYDTGQNASVALSDDGWVIEVHETEKLFGRSLWSRVGKLDEHLEISWGEAAEYDSGKRPTIRFVGPSTAREVHKSAGNDDRWCWDVRLDLVSKRAQWTNHDRTSDAFFNRTSSQSGGHSIDVSVAVDAEFGANTLQYRTGSGRFTRICPEQLAFVEHQPSDGDALRGVRFYAASAGDRDWLVAARNAGRVVRAWDFESEHADALLAVNFPATNEPQADWYQRFLERAGAVRP